MKFPPYRPEENPTEQVWKTAKHAAANTYYPDEETYRLEIRRILRKKINQNVQILKSLNIYVQM